MSEFNKKYNPKDFEKRLQDFWEDNWYFKPKPWKTGKTFYIPMPPPNVTGKLHLGHALTLSIQDTMIRYHRMLWDETLYVPWTDHAGISTQAVVEKKLESEWKSREKMWRDKFIKEVWKWKEEYEANIHAQTRVMWTSADWSKVRFTFDDDLNKLVEYTFVDLYKKELLYKWEYMVNYSPKLKTVISDAEVVYKDIDSKMYYITYFVAGTDKQLVIATTRPETLLADQAVAVNPKDKRFKKLIWRDVILPLVNKRIPIIWDESVKMDFWTWALKITPAHDPVDFAIWKAHGLILDYEVITKDWFMNLNSELESGPSLVWQDIDTARENIVEMLKSRWNLDRVEDYKQSVWFCERSWCRIQSVISTQWFVDAKKMSEKVINWYERWDFDFIPTKFRKTFEDWIFNLHEWCISRQLWWWHQIPAYYDKSTWELIWVTEDPTDLYKKYWKENVKRDEDVLDTWFSSALWPYSILDWDEKNPWDLFKKFYKAQVLETGYDIMLFWVVRMLLFWYEYTWTTPFEKVYLHWLILAEDWSKMSKSKWNWIDPIDVIEKYSSDALRLAITIWNTPWNNFNFSMKKVEDNSMFLNKFWNLSRFVLMNTWDITKDYNVLKTSIENNYDWLMTHEKWIISKLKELVDNVTESMEDFTFNEAAQSLKSFTKNSFADYYIEEYKLTKDISKYSDLVLQFCLLTLLKLWHPYAPHITEEIYNKVTNNKILIDSDWPDLNITRDILVETQMNFVTRVIKWIRIVRADAWVKPKDLTKLVIDVKDEEQEYLDNNKEILLGLSKCKDLDFCVTDGVINSTDYSLTVEWSAKIYIKVWEFISAEDEINRLNLEIKDKKEYIRILDNKLLNPSFVANAPAKLVRIEQDKRSKAETELKALSESLDNI